MSVGGDAGAGGRVAQCLNTWSVSGLGRARDATPRDLGIEGDAGANASVRHWAQATSGGGGSWVWAAETSKTARHVPAACAGLPMPDIAPADM